MLNSVVEPAAGLLPVSGPYIPQRGTVGAKSISDDNLWSTMLSHRFLEEFQCGFLVSGLGHQALQDLAFVIDSPPKVVPLAVDLHKHLVEVPLPVAGSHPFDPAFPDFVREHRAEPMPPKSNRFVADVDAAFMQQILDIPE